MSLSLPNGHKKGEHLARLPDLKHPTIFTYYFKVSGKHTCNTFGSVSMLVN